MGVRPPSRVPEGGSDQAHPGVPKMKLISTTDIITAGGLAGMALVSWCVPEKAWYPIARLAAPLPVSLALQTKENAVRIDEVVGDHPIALSARDIQLESMAGFIVGNLRVLKDYCPGGWNPEIEVRGGEHVEAGLRRGRGVVLWMSHFNAYSLAAKIGLHRAGYLVSHLSLWRHGFSDTRFGMRFLNPTRTKIEERYLRERVVIAPDGSIAALKTLRQRLRGNGIVSITATSDSDRPVVAPFLDGRIRLASGAPFVAYRAKAALLPVFPTEEEDGRFTIVIGAPLEREGTGSVRDYADWAAQAYASQLEPYVLEKPSQWRGWYYL